LFAGGHSGGAGGGTSWASDHPRPGLRAEQGPGRDGPKTGGGWSLDLDELVWVIVAIVALFGGLICVFYVVYIAPLLLAEVALDAALVSVVYRRLRHEDTGHWAGAVVGRTWLPAIGLLVFMAILGFALQQIVPEARSIGAVIRALV
jgi:hypothetical protein